MSWQHRIALVMLTVLVGLPIAGTACAIACESAPKAVAAHHGASHACEEPARPSAGSQIGSASQHDCSTHDAVLWQAPTTAAERADAVATSVPVVIITIPTALETLRTIQSLVDDIVRPGTAPPTITPLVLRV